MAAKVDTLIMFAEEFLFITIVAYFTKVQKILYLNLSWFYNIQSVNFAYMAATIPRSAQKVMLHIILYIICWKIPTRISKIN